MSAKCAIATALLFGLVTCRSYSAQNQSAQKQIKITQQSDCVQDGSEKNCVLKYEVVRTPASPPSFWQLVLQLFDFRPAVRPFERSVAFLVGVGKYKYLTPQLPYVETDLRDMREFLLNEAGFDTVYVASGSVVSTHLLEQYMMNRFNSEITDKDRLLFYFSGHGNDYETNVGYIQFSKATKAFDSDQSLRVSEADVWSTRLHARHILFIFDSCFSGHGWDRGWIPKAESSTTENLINTVSGNSSRYVITAGSGKEKAFQIQVSTNQGYSVFTHELIKALRDNPAYSQQGFVLLEQAFGEARVGVAKFTGPNGLKMNPQIFSRPRTEADSGDFVFVNANAKGAVLPQTIRQQFGIIQKEGAGPARVTSRKVPPAVGAMFSQPITKNAGGATALVSGDFNGDGIPDLIALNPRSGNIDVWIGQGDGTFQYAQSYSSGGTPYAAVAYDLNRDGHLDVAVANSPWSGKSPSVAVFLGNGDGTFRAPYITNAGSEPTAIVAADFDGDGNPDLAIGSRKDNSVYVLLGKGDGTFRESVSYRVGGNVFCLATGDFNMDGTPDLAVGTTGKTGLSVMLGKGNGDFAEPKEYLISPDILKTVDTYSIAVADLNGDNKPDLALTSFRANSVAVLLGNGDGTFQDVKSYPVGDGPFHVVAVDLDATGRRDLVSANNSNTISVLMGAGDGTFGIAENYPAGYSPDNIAVGDFNGDGLQDLAIANRGDGSISVLLNTSKRAAISVASDHNPSILGQPVTFTATVVSNEGDAQGMIEFSSDGNILGTKPVSDGSASVTTRALGAGVHNVVASYITKGTISQKSPLLSQETKLAP